MGPSVIQVLVAIYQGESGSDRSRSRRCGPTFYEAQCYFLPPSPQHSPPGHQVLRGLEVHGCAVVLNNATGV